MLQFKECSNTVKTYVDFDFYSPIKIDFGYWDITKEPTLYWSTGNFQTSLIEIGIGQKNGTIRSLTLVLANHIKFSTKPETFDKNNEKTGLPSFKTKKWGVHNIYLEEVSDFEVYIENNRVVIKLMPHKIEFKIINDRVAFGFDNNKSLSTIEVRNLTADEKSILEEKYRLYKPSI